MTVLLSGLRAAIGELCAQLLPVEVDVCSSLQQRPTVRLCRCGLGTLYSLHQSRWPVSGDLKLVALCFADFSLGVVAPGDTTDLWKGGEYAGALYSIAPACAQAVVSLHRRWALTLSIQLLR